MDHLLSTEESALDYSSNTSGYLLTDESAFDYSNNSSDYLIHGIHHHDQSVRFLAGGGEEVAALDYSVLSVVVMTLGIVLFVEVGRHQLDVMASGQLFFQTVLELVYQELTTLGFVEVIIHLLHVYVSDLNVATEAIFIDVHFMLFYTAVINGFQSVLLRLFTSRRTDRLWVKTEEVETEHYVAIRQEFQNVERKLKKIELERTNRISAMREADPFSDLWHESFLSSISTFFRQMFREVVNSIRYPRLSRRRRELSRFIRFHYLRVHFIQSNNLPGRFKVSDYLKRSLTRDLLDFVHISSNAWILLMATINLAYFLSGIILHVTKSRYTVGLFLFDIYFALCILFVAIGIIVYLKMRWIYIRVLNLEPRKKGKSTEDVDNRGDVLAIDKDFDQRDLFWGGNPTYILDITKYMQFGFALAFAMIASYWKELKNKAPVDFIWLLLAPLIAYCCFLYFLVKIIPRYTLCTSLGQLVDDERLQETLAKAKLVEAVREKETLLEEKKVEEAVAQRRKEIAAKMINELAESSILPVVENSDSLRSNLPKLKESLSDAQFRELSELVHMSTEDLPAVPKRKTRRTRRQRSVSGSLAFMRNTTTTSSGEAERRANMFPERPITKSGSVGSLDRPGLGSGSIRLPQRPLRKSGSTGYLATHLHTSSSSEYPTSNYGKKKNAEVEDEIKPACSDSQLETLNKLVRLPTEDLPAIPSRSQGRKNQRLRSVSAGVSFMRKTMSASSDDTDRESNLPTLNETPLLHEEKKHEDTPSLPSPKEILSDAQFQELKRSIVPRHRPLRKSGSTGYLTHLPTSASSEYSTSNFGHQKIAEVEDEIKPACSDLETLNKLVLLPTEDLPAIPSRSQGRKNQRLRSVSAGVSFMRKTMSASSDDTDRESNLPTLQEGKKHGDALSEVPSHEGIELSELGFLSEEAPTIESKETQGAMANADAILPDDSAESVDGHSDIDDVPDVVPDVVTTEPWQSQGNLSTFFLSEAYRSFSDLIGPMACFFWIAMRVETFNIESDTLVDNDNTLHMNLKTSFWVQLAWYIGMICEFVTVLYTMQSRKDDIGKVSVVAALSGLALTIGCLIVLLVAESQRCCSTDDYLDVNCCTEFGGRTYGGLGSIEPFTSLIALSPLRFHVAPKLLFLWKGGTTRIDLHHDEHSGHEHGGHHGPDVVTKARELWLATMGKHSSVAKKYGAFSGELLQCMIGVDLFQLEQTEPQPDDAFAVSSKRVDKERKTAKIVTHDKHQMEKVTTDESHGTPDDKELIPNKYRRLSIGSQSLILSGVLGKEASIMSNMESVEEESTPDYSYDFTHPNSTLIRRMRRCERRIFFDNCTFPEWTVADAILTSHELVLFAVVDEDNRQPFVEEALAATHGGKGLRLCDVAKGRTVLDHFDLEDIDLVRIERRMAVVAGERDIEKSRQDQHFQFEFWQGGCDQIGEYDGSSVNKRWIQVDEDRLKIHFNFGTLFLRFMVDLREMECQKTTPTNSNTDFCAETVSEGSNLWCRTIARIRGASHLKQSLPHFGQGKDELGDFIENYERESEEEHHGKLDTVRHLFSRSSFMHRREIITEE